MVAMNLISIRDIDKKEIERILDLALKKEQELKSGKVTQLKGILATLFFEASTRTRLSFQASAARLGMSYINLEAEASSLMKGESFLDTIRMVEGYADILAIRHPKEGAAKLASEISKKPIINCGDGGNQHPTQTLIDLYTMAKYKKSFKGLNVMLLGDLKHARTMNSLIYALAMFDTNLTLVAPDGLEMDKHHIKEVEEKFNVKIDTKHEFSAKGIDVLYVCRIQKERFADPYEAKRVEEKFRIRLENLKDAKDDLAILHPLPKTSEIDHAIDSTKHAKYFEQAHYAVPVRMAVIDYLLRGGK